jgi:hypothetical protein
VAKIGEIRNALKILIGKRELNRILGRPRRKKEDNIKVVLYEGLNWIHRVRIRKSVGLW